VGGSIRIDVGRVAPWRFGSGGGLPGWLLRDHHQSEATKVAQAMVRTIDCMAACLQTRRKGAADPSTITAGANLPVPPGLAGTCLVERHSATATWQSEIDRQSYMVMSDFEHRFGIVCSRSCGLGSSFKESRTLTQKIGQIVAICGGDEDHQTY
jgi:hypothetical protein